MVHDVAKSFEKSKNSHPQRGWQNFKSINATLKVDGQHMVSPKSTDLPNRWQNSKSKNTIASAIRHFLSLNVRDRCHTFRPNKHRNHVSQPWIRTWHTRCIRAACHNFYSKTAIKIVLQINTYDIVFRLDTTIFKQNDRYDILRPVFVVSRDKAIG